MNFKPPKNTEKYFWTRHAAYKLRQYGLSAQRIIRVINNPQRNEEGIVPRTAAVMQPAAVKNKNGKKTWNQEIWAMYQTRRAGNPKSEARNTEQIPASPKTASRVGQNSKFEILNSANRQIRIISAWRYPGVSPKRNPIPDEILRELDNIT